MTALDQLAGLDLDNHAKAALAKCSDTDLRAVLAILVDLQKDDPGAALDLGVTVDAIRRLHPRRREKLAARVDDKGNVFDTEAPPPPPADDDADGASYGRLLEQDAERAEAVERRAALAQQISGRAFQIVAEAGIGWESARQQAARELVEV